MKQRIITGIIGAMIMAFILFFHNSWLFNIMIGIIAMIAVYEVLAATKYNKIIPLTVTSLIFAGSAPFFIGTDITPYAILICFGYILLFFFFVIIWNAKVAMEKLGMALFMSLVVPIGLSCAVYLRTSHPNDHLFLVVLLLLCAWITDTAAYFTGSFLGKHKLIPAISPKKTVEGALGGLIACVLICTAAGLFYQSQIAASGSTVSLPILILLAAVSSVIGMLGDLSASLVKRCCGIKDFGSLLPGHGGILDRFDSFLFVAPAIYFAANYLPLITHPQ